MILRTTLPCFFLLLLCTCTFGSLSNHVHAQSESQYIKALADHFGGEREVSVAGGRIDILNDKYAIEVERAPKWKNSIGQALWYGLQTTKTPGIILLVESPGQRKYAIQLGSALAYAGLEGRVKVWLWPEDFPGVTPAATTTQRPGMPAGVATKFWLNLNGNKRHTADCTWFANTKRGRYCTEAEGVAAGCCN